MGGNRRMPAGPVSEEVEFAEVDDFALFAVEDLALLPDAPAAGFAVGEEGVEPDPLPRD
jgi:hypothetical protein